jgi:hypothetical protein
MTMALFVNMITLVYRIVSLSERHFNSSPGCRSSSSPSSMEDNWSSIRKHQQMMQSQKRQQKPKRNAGSRGQESRSLPVPLVRDCSCGEEGGRNSDDSDSEEEGVDQEEVVEEEEEEEEVEEEEGCAIMFDREGGSVPEIVRDQKKRRAEAEWMDSNGMATSKRRLVALDLKGTISHQHCIALA